jgi:hypothetical protein
MNRRIAEAVIDYLSDQFYQTESILHPIIAIDFVSRERMIKALTDVIDRQMEKEVENYDI